MDSALLTPDLLAPGDGKAASLDPAHFTWSRIHSADDPLFEKAYSALWAEFGAAHEMETRGVLAGRLAAGGDLCSEMVVAQSAGAIAAVRDQTAIWFEGEVVVHLSHLLVAPEWRRSGLAGWMRAVSILTARTVAGVHGKPDAPITLVCEMEYDDGSDPRRAVRLLAYERAGFLKIDPRAVRYFQPDFRAPAEIDASVDLFSKRHSSGELRYGARPLPFQLLLRRVGSETQTTITGAEVRRIVRALYAMYAAQFRPQDMAHPALSLADYPDENTEVALIAPIIVA